MHSLIASQMHLCIDLGQGREAAQRIESSSHTLHFYLIGLIDLPGISLYIRNTCIVILIFESASINCMHIWSTPSPQALKTYCRCKWYFVQFCLKQCQIASLCIPVLILDWIIIRSKGMSRFKDNVMNCR